MNESPFVRIVLFVLLYVLYVVFGNLLFHILKLESLENLADTLRVTQLLFPNLNLHTKPYGIFMQFRYTNEYIIYGAIKW